MKVFKKMASVMLALTLCLGLFGLVACNKGDDKATGYSFRVVDAENAPVVGATVQICSDMCLDQITDEKGEVFFEKCGELAWEIHVYVGGNTMEFEGSNTTPTTYNSEIIVLKLS